MQAPLFSAGLLALLLCPTPGSGQTVTDALEELRTGNYEDAESSFRSVLKEDATSIRARRGLIDVLTFTGEYDEARSIALEAPEPVGIANALGEVLVLGGNLDEADAAFRRAIDGNAPDALTAQANLAELLFNRGEIDEAMRRFDRFIDIYNGADGRLRAEDLVAVGRAVTYLGRAEPTLFNDALKAFDEASSAESYFEATIQRQEIPDEMPEYEVDGEQPLHRVLTAAGIASSGGEVRRLVGQGAVSVNGDRVQEFTQAVQPGDEIRVGRHRFLRVTKATEVS